MTCMHSGVYVFCAGYLILLSSVLFVCYLTVIMLIFCESYAHLLIVSFPDPPVFRAEHGRVWERD